MSIEVADGDLIKFRRVGEHFKYLGVDMIVACFLRAPRGVIGSGRWDTIMLAHYIGGHQIRSMEFTQSMMNALISENNINTDESENCLCSTAWQGAVTT